MQFLTLAILNDTFIIKKNILELMNGKNTIIFINTRQIKIPRYSLLFYNNKIMKEISKEVEYVFGKGHVDLSNEEKKK